MEFRRLREHWKQRRIGIFIRAQKQQRRRSQIDVEAVGVFDTCEILDGRGRAFVNGAKAGCETLDYEERRDRRGQVAAQHGKALDQHALAQHNVARQAWRRAWTFRRRQHHRLRRLSYAARSSNCKRASRA
jgi:hypothetical protein